MEGVSSGLRPKTETQPNRRPKSCGRCHQPGRPGGRGHGLPAPARDKERGRLAGAPGPAQHTNIPDGNSLPITSFASAHAPCIPPEPAATWAEDMAGDKTHTVPTLGGFWARDNKQGNKCALGTSSEGKQSQQSTGRVALGGHGCRWELREALQQVARSVDTCAKSRSWQHRQSGQGYPGAGAGAAGQSSSGLGLSAGGAAPGRPGDRTPRKLRSVGAGRRAAEREGARGSVELLVGAPLSPQGSLAHQQRLSRSQRKREGSESSGHTAREGQKPGANSESRARPCPPGASKPKPWHPQVLRE